MATGLYLGTDFVPTYIYDREDFPKNAFVVKVKGSSVQTQTHQKCMIYKTYNSNQLCIRVGNDKYILLNENGTNYSIGGTIVGNYLDTDYTFVPHINNGTMYFVSNTVDSYSSATWQQLTSALPGIKAVSAKNTATIPVTNEVFIYSNDPTPWKYYGSGGDLIMDIYTLDLSGYNATNIDGKISKLLYDQEIAIIRTPPTTKLASTAGFVCSDHFAMIVRSVKSASVANGNPRGIFVSEPNTGLWIDKVTKMRVNYLGLNTALSTGSTTVYSIVNENLLPVDLYSVSDLGLERIEPPVLAEEDAVSRVIQFFSNFIDIKTIFTILGLYIAYLYLSGTGTLETLRAMFTGGGGQ